MSDFNVSLRLRLINQLSRPAEEAKRDLKELGDAAERLGRARGGQQLAGDLGKLGRDATDAKDRIVAIDGAADRARLAIGRIDSGVLDRMRTDADQAGRAILEIGDQADRTRQAITRIDDGAFDGLRTDAQKAETAIRQIGTAADATHRKIDAIRMSGVNPFGAAAGLPAYRTTYGLAPGAPGLGIPLGVPVGMPAVPPRVAPPPLPGFPVPGASVPGRAGGLADIGRAAYDRTGMDAHLPIGMGVGYMVGGGVAAAAIGGAGAYRNYGGFNREMGLLGNTAGVDMDTVEKGIEELRDIANIAKLTFRQAFEGFRALLESGLEWDDALENMPSVAKTTTASGADASQIAVTQQATQRSMGLNNSDLPKASDIMVAGGNAGQFELRDMAAYLPSLLSAGGAAGYSGLEGLSSIVASAQVLRARTGTAQSAAAQLTNVLLKMNSAETMGNFEDYDVDVAGGLAAGKTRGEDPIETFLDLTDQAIERGAQLNLLFRDQELYLGMNSLRQGREERTTLQGELMTADGATDTNFNRIAGDAQASLDLLSNSMVRLTFTAGELIHRLGGTAGVDYLSDRLDSLMDDPVRAISPPLGALRDMIMGAPGDDKASGGRNAARTAAAINGRTEDALSEDVSGAASASMDGYNAELAAEGEEAVGTAMSIADRIRAALGFTVSPTIAPTYRDAPAGPTSRGRNAGRGRAGGGQQSSLGPAPSGVNLTQNISSPNSRTAARKAQREQDRSIRMAQARANYDLGSVWS